MESRVRVVVFLMTLLVLAALTGLGLALFGNADLGVEEEAGLIKLLGGGGVAVAFFLNGPISGAIIRKRQNRRQ